jgi:hypothetical protein
VDLLIGVERMRREFTAMPGLRLTPQQAARLMGLDRRACEEVVNRLVAASFLEWSSGTVMRRAA